MKKIFLVILLLCSSLLFAQEAKWVKAIGECVAVNITNEEAIKRAVKEAELNAIKEVVGIKITSELLDKVAENQKDVYELFSKISHSTLSGRIVEERILTRNFDFVDGLPKYTVGIEAKVVKEEGQSDIDFNVGVKLDKDVFYDYGSAGSDELIFTIDASKDCYIYVFNLMSDNSVQLILPNPYIKDNSYKTFREVQNFAESFKKVKLRVKVPEKKSNSIEALYVIALKDKYDILNDPEWKDKIDKGDSVIGTIHSIQNWLIKIPIDRRTESFAQYEIREKQK